MILFQLIAQLSTQLLAQLQSAQYLNIQRILKAHLLLHRLSSFNHYLAANDATKRLPGIFRYWCSTVSARMSLLSVFNYICRKFSSRLRGDLLERSIARAKAIRSVSLLRRKVQWTFRASSAVSAYSASVVQSLEDYKKQ
ncbi:hypothetical protein [Gardnerella sp. 26-12]|nr:hypothetical protein [Gardnerella sp. 26-12]